MRITQADLSMTQNHRLVQHYERREQLELFRRDEQGEQQRVVIGAQVDLSADAQRLSAQVAQQDKRLGRYFAAQPDGGSPEGSAGQSINASRPGPDPTQERALPRPSTRAPDTSPLLSPSSSYDWQTLTIIAVIEQLTGRTIQLFDATQLNGRIEATASAQLVVSDTNTEDINSPTDNQPVAFGLRYEVIERFREEEYSQFEARGELRTADGRSLHLQIELHMARSFTREQRQQLSAGIQLADPLVVNLTAAAARLSGEQLAFDLDSDGVAESVPMLASSSGFLMLDRNDNGRVDNGSELFGTQSGDGFDDLAAYDEDGNGFIDEGDSLYNLLRIWVRKGGDDHLLTLAETGVGALYLGRSDTPFKLTDDQNQLLGQIRSSGVFLFEDGRSGSLQQVDLKI